MNRVTIFRIAVIVIGSIILIFSTMKQNQPAEALQYESKFEVVDRYQNRCDVIQYTPDNSARYSYFLDCK
jgi:hypothetical protein